MKEHTQAQNGGQWMCIPPPGAGRMSARGFKQRCTKIINRHRHTHTYTDTHTHGHTVTHLLLSFCQPPCPTDTHTLSHTGQYTQERLCLIKGKPHSSPTLGNDMFPITQSNSRPRSGIRAFGPQRIPHGPGG